MFVRAQRSGKRTYLLVVENEWAAGKVRQKVLHRLGRLDILQKTGKLDFFCGACGVSYGTSQIVLHRQ